MRFILEIECNNAAFEPDAKHEIARILRERADMIETYSTGKLFDINGNRVGQWSLK